MNHFSKFLLDKEELKLIIRPKTNNLKVYFIYLCIAMTFFLLYPMFSWGRHGFFLWLFLFIYLIVLLAQAYIAKLNFYLLTNKRIIYVKAINKEKFAFRGAIYLKNIDSIKKSGRHSIVLIVDEKKYYLQSLENRDDIYKKVENML
jgi:hypothetical protein